MSKKSMTIRYRQDEEQNILKLLEITHEKTMNKAFLKTPTIIINQNIKIIRMSKVIDDQRDQIEKLNEIVNSWTNFNNKLENFLNKDKEDKNEK